MSLVNNRKRPYSMLTRYYPYHDVMFSMKCAYIGRLGVFLFFFRQWQTTLLQFLVPEVYMGTCVCALWVVTRRALKHTDDYALWYAYTSGRPLYNTAANPHTHAHIPHTPHTYRFREEGELYRYIYINIQAESPRPTCIHIHC